MAAEPIYAPYARAAATVKRDGALVRQKNIVSVQRTATGTYKVTVAETIDTASAAVQVTADSGANWGTEVYTTPLQGHAVQVLTGRNGAASDQPFHLAVL